jgi:sugar lactone lactonase YvrE
MKKGVAAVASILVALLLYFLLWPVPINPVAWDAPQNLGLVDPFERNDRLKPAHAIDLGIHSGPEDVTAGLDGRLYATSKDGFLLQIDGYGNVSEFAQVGGRPLGLETDRDGSFVVANAYLGIQRVSPNGAVENLLSEVDGQPLVYADDLAIASDGTVYFSEASTHFGASQYEGTYEGSLLDIMEHGASGQVIAFSPDTGSAKIIIENLNFANGVAVSADQTYLLIAETGAYRILRYWLKGPRLGETEVIIDNLPGFPDNINNGLNESFWIGLVTPRNALLDRLSSKPFVRKIVQRLPAFVRPKAVPSSHVISINGDGEVLMNLQDPAARFPALTGVFETRDALYLTSLFGNELARLDKNDL